MLVHRLTLNYYFGSDSVAKKTLSEDLSNKEVELKNH